MSGKIMQIWRLRWFDKREISSFRYALGASLAALIAFGFAWEMSFLVPVLLLGFLAPGAKRPTFQGGVLFVGQIAFASIISLIFCIFFLDYMLIYLPLLALLFFYLFFTEKIKPVPKTWLLVSFLLIPLLGLQSMKIAYFITISLIFNSAVSLLIVWIVFALLPDPASEQTENIPEITKMEAPGNSDREKLQLALERLIVVFPVVLFFFFFQWTGSALVLIFIAILSMQPGFAKDFKAGKILIAGNLMGGIASIVVYEWLVIVPEFYFLGLLVFLTGLVVSINLFSSKPVAPLYGMAFSTFLLIIGKSTTGTEDAGASVWIRVLQILTAVIYIVFAFGLIEYFKNNRKDRKASRLSKKIAPKLS